MEAQVFFIWFAIFFWTIGIIDLLRYKFSLLTHDQARTRLLEIAITFLAGITAIYIAEHFAATF